MLSTTRDSAHVATERRVVLLRPRRTAATCAINSHHRSACDTRLSTRCVRCSRPGERSRYRALCRAAVDHSAVVVASLRRARQPGGASSIRLRPHRSHRPARIVARRGRRKQARREECNALRPLEPRLSHCHRASWQLAIVQAVAVLRGHRYAHGFFRTTRGLGGGQRVRRSNHPRFNQCRLRNHHCSIVGSSNVCCACSNCGCIVPPLPP